MSHLARLPLSSVRRRRVCSASLCLRDESAYTSFLRIQTHGSNRPSKLWGKQQHMHSVSNCRENTKGHILSVSFCRTLLTYIEKKCCYCINRRQLRHGINITYRHNVWRLVSQDKNLFWGAYWVHEIWHATKLPLLACSDFKASTQSAVSNNLRAKIRAEQGLSDFINTDRFIFLSLMPQ